MRADRLQTNTYPISHRPARAALCLLLGAGILALAVYLQLGPGHRSAVARHARPQARRR